MNDLIKTITQFLLNEDSPKNLKESVKFVSKGIFTQDGKKVDGERKSKLFLAAVDENGYVHDMSWKEWSASNLKDTSSDLAKKQFIDRLAKQIKAFNKRVDLNTWLKAGDRSFVDTVNYIFKLDLNIKYPKTGLKEEAATDMLHNLSETVVDKDISAIIDFAVNELGADLHKGNTLDFGQGSVIKVSKKGGKILFDGGMSNGKEYFKNAKDAIASLAVGMDESVLQEERSPNFESHVDRVIAETELSFDKLRKNIEKNSDILIKNSGVDSSVHKLYKNRVNKIKDLLSEAESIFINDIVKDLDD